MAEADLKSALAAEISRLKIELQQAENAVIALQQRITACENLYKEFEHGQTVTIRIGEQRHSHDVTDKIDGHRESNSLYAKMTLSQGVIAVLKDMGDGKIPMQTIFDALKDGGIVFNNKVESKNFHAMRVAINRLKEKGIVDQDNVTRDVCLVNRDSVTGR